MLSSAPDKRYQIVHADCRKFNWPDLDHIVADPPWEDLNLYHWFGSFASTRLRKGGSAFVQCKTVDLLKVGRILEDAGLTFVTELSIQFPQALPQWAFPLNLTFRPVLLFANGKWNTQGLARRHDSSKAEDDFKPFHPWQQPMRPWERWLSGLTRPGEVVGDCFACTATVGCALKAVGGRFYIGTEIDEQNPRVGQGRLADQPEGIRTETWPKRDETERVQCQ